MRARATAVLCGGVLISACLERHPDYEKGSGGGQGTGSGSDEVGSTDGGADDGDGSTGGGSGGTGGGSTATTDGGGTGDGGSTGTTHGGGTGDGGSTATTHGGGTGDGGSTATTDGGGTGDGGSTATTDPDTTTGDGGSTSTTTDPDTTTGSGTSSTGTGDECSPLWAEPGWTLSTPEHLADLNSGGFDGDPHLGPDSLTLYFASDRGGGQGGADIYFATRADRGAPFLNVTSLDEVNTNRADLTFAVAEGGLVAIFTSERTGGEGGSDLWEATRSSVSDPWSMLTPITELSSSDQEYDAHTRDGLTLYYNVAGGGEQNNYVTTRASLTDPFPAGMPLSTNSTSGDDSPTVTGDGLLLVFGSSRPGGMGGSQDLYYATRPSVSDDWSAPQPLPVVNTGDREGETHLRFDGCELFFVSDKAGGLGGWDLYRTTFVAP